MVRPEPYEPLDEADLGPTRCVDPSLGLGEKNSTWQRFLVGLAGRRFLGLITYGFHTRITRPSGMRRELCLRRTCGSEFEHRAKRGVAAQEPGINDLPGVRPVEFGRERPLRVGGDQRNRLGARAEPEPMQC